ncbi:putative ATP-dependent RNA helicase DDX49 [Porphyridium purpureum]|uniref:Putative ATP-dependent RNA helicase DDX49 n=1 Tax=Porphyridium purpureum TaxID=35688 RepID=A0A5J4YQD2_PORPP|nr:putative ATP-dependent RNA helicase DDX49 [Porphyridium purpureum]|eukprot:POR4157..scf296_7
MSFAELGVNAQLCHVLSELAMVTPTPIQTSLVPSILSGRKHVVGAAPTGAGKSAAFMLPILTRLAAEPRAFYALILTPTRELAVQLDELARALGVFMRARTALLVGGGDVTAQRAELHARPHLVIATPGRMAAFLRDDDDIEVDSSHLTRSVKRQLRKVRALVLDEADQLLIPDFAQELHMIMDCVRQQDAAPAGFVRQTVLVSATMSGVMRSLVEQGWLQNADVFDHTNPAARMAELQQLEHWHLLVPQRVKEVYLAYILLNDIGLPRSMTQVELENDKAANRLGHKRKRERAAAAKIIFVSTCFIAEWLTLTLQAFGMNAVRLHSRMPPKHRTRALHEFRAGRAEILVATDLAARGLDIPHVQLVINYDIPSSGETYVHRTGRTARAGRAGTALSLVSEMDVLRFHAVEAFLGGDHGTSGGNSNGTHSKSLSSATSSIPELRAGIEEDDVMQNLTAVLKAKRLARVSLAQSGMWEKQLIQHGKSLEKQKRLNRPGQAQNMNG